MIFKYKRYSPKILRPVIPIGISSNNIYVYHEVLIDSGADYCLFDAEIADILGFELTKGKKNFVIGISGDPEPFYVHPITIHVKNSTYAIDAGFKRNKKPWSYSIVGQNGFFTLFLVTFDVTKGKIVLLDRSNIN